MPQYSDRFLLAAAAAGAALLAATYLAQRELRKWQILNSYLRKVCSRHHQSVAENYVWGLFEMPICTMGGRVLML